MDKRTMLILRKHIPTVLRIKTTDAATFSKYDTAGVAADLNKTDWSNYQLSKTSAKAKAIVHIINSTVGHRCQDQLMDGQMETYVKEAASLGVTAMDAKMMCANFRHQGGLSAVKRILAKTTKPYTLDHLMQILTARPQMQEPLIIQSIGGMLHQNTRVRHGVPAL